MIVIEFKSTFPDNSISFGCIKILKAIFFQSSFSTEGLVARPREIKMFLIEESLNLRRVCKTLVKSASMVEFGFEASM